jgi:hypothetical protein
LNLLAAFFVAYVFLWNLRTVDFERFSRIFPREWTQLGFAFGLDQFWTMFAPRPPTDDGWYVAPGTLQDGEEVDLLRGGTPVRWEKPELVSSLYRNERWRKFMMNLCRTGQGDNRVNLVNYLWSDWKRSHPPDQQLTRLELVYMHEETLPDYRKAEPRKLLLCWRTLPVSGNE